MVDDLSDDSNMARMGTRLEEHDCIYDQFRSFDESSPFVPLPTSTKRLKVESCK